MAIRATLLEQVLISMLTQDSISSRRSPAGPAFIVSAVLALAGSGFLIVAGYEWIAMHYDVQTAQIGVGLLALALALIVATGAYAVHIYKLKKVRAYYNVVKDNINNAMHLVADELEEPIRENPKTAMLMASLAGYVAAEKLLH